MEHTYYKTILLVLIGCMIAASAYIILTTSKNPSLNVNVSSAEAVTVEDTVATEGVLRVPNGFPTDVPIEESNLLEGFKVTHQDKGLVIYSIKYSSVSSPSDKWGEYNEFLSQGGYTLLATTSKKPSVIKVSGQKDDSVLSADISEEGGQTIVRLQYYER